jgi:hypothetical protein
MTTVRGRHAGVKHNCQLLKKSHTARLQTSKELLECE